ncbi:hypothetical protein JCM5350_006116 [Sporobolomyces pararoseus]
MPANIDKSIKSTRTDHDHLSRLPNELLTSIFDYAYSVHPPKRPISKHFLPFFDAHLYRRVSLRHPSQIDFFIETVSSSPQKAKLVYTLSLQPFFRRPPPDSSARISSLLPLLPNLVELNISPELLDLCSSLLDTFSTLSSIRRVKLAPRTLLGSLVDSNYFAPIAALPNLTELTINNWPARLEWIAGADESSLCFKHVQRLEIQGKGAAEETVSRIVNSCPNLLRLDLFSNWGDPLESFDNLNSLPITLESLSLALSYESTSPIDDSLLLRFVNLRRLYLGSSCYSSSIYSTLRKLPLLEKVQLGEGPFSFSEVVPLISGPTRSPRLQELHLTFDLGVPGGREDDEHRSGGFDGSMSDWMLPRDGDREELNLGQLRELLKLAKENKVVLHGVDRAVTAFEEYWIEANNRAILDALDADDTDDFIKLRRVRSDTTKAGLSTLLPPLDIDSLQPGWLELVKIELPERNWFMYSLKNGDKPTRRRRSDGEYEDEACWTLEYESDPGLEEARRWLNEDVNWEDPVDGHL